MTEIFAFGDYCNARRVTWNEFLLHSLNTIIHIRYSLKFIKTSLMFSLRNSQDDKLTIMNINCYIELRLNKFISLACMNFCSFIRTFAHEK